MTTPQPDPVTDREVMSIYEAVHEKGWDAAMEKVPRPDPETDLITDEMVNRLISPNGFDGHGPVPEKVTEAAKATARLRVKFVSQWTPGMENPLTTRELQQLFDAAAVDAEWSRELYEARDALSATIERQAAEIERLREALKRIAWYDARWKGQHVNDAPSRAELIGRAYDALALPQEREET